jgi:hypothetical protein
MITWPEFVLPDVGLFVVMIVGTWFCNALRHWVLHDVEVSSSWSSKPLCQVVDVVL